MKPVASTVEAVAMARIATRTEQEGAHHQCQCQKSQPIPNAISQAVSQIAGNSLGAAAIMTLTKTGSTARNVKFRPHP